MSIPLKDSLLVPYATNFNTRINGQPSRWGFSVEEAAAYTEAMEPYVEAYNVMMATRADGTRSKNQTDVKNAAKAAFLSLAREYYGLVQANSNISDADKGLVGVHVRDTDPSPIPAPTVRPGMDIVSIVQRQMELSIHDSASSTKRGKPAGAVQALVYFFAGEDYPSDPNGWSFAGVATRNKFTFHVPDSVPGGTRVWVCAAWTNRTGDAGPTNVPISANIQGGGTTAVQMKLAA